MRKILLKIEYKGTNYSGWQRQNNAKSIQGLIEDTLFLTQKQKISIYGASRTDAGVHALSQFATFIDSSNIPSDKFKYILNNHLPMDIRIVESKEVDINFNCRHDAINKTYEYYIDNGTNASAIYGEYNYFFPQFLDIEKMKLASQLIIGTHDFSSFEAVGGSTISKIRTIYDSYVEKNNNIIKYTVTGNGFLYNMVRIIVGTLVDVGLGKIDLENINKAYQIKDRRLLGHTAPACGLFLSDINYK